MEDYHRLYVKIMNKPDVFVKEGELEKWADNDVKTYAQIRIIGNLDQVIVNTNYRNDDYLRLKKQEIENKGKVDLIEFIRPFNTRWLSSNPFLFIQFRIQNKDHISFFFFRIYWLCWERILYAI